MRNISGRENDDEIIVLKVVDIGTQEMVNAKSIYDRAVDMNSGSK